MGLGRGQLPSLHSTPLPMGEGQGGGASWVGGGGFSFPYLQPHRVLYICLTDQLQVAFAERTDPYILSGTD